MSNKTQYNLQLTVLLLLAGGIISGGIYGLTKDDKRRRELNQQCIADGHKAYECESILYHSAIAQPVFIHVK